MTDFGPSEKDSKRRSLDASAAARLMQLLLDSPLQGDAPGPDVAAGGGNGSTRPALRSSTHTDREHPAIPGYYVSRLIGAGAGGSVYEAYRAGSAQRVAVKVMSTKLGSGSSAQRAWRELDMLGQLHLQVVPRLIDFGEVGGHLFVTTEFVDGFPLDQFCRETQRACPAVGEDARAGAGEPVAAVQDGEPLSRRDRVALLARVASAVQALHEKGIIHRDLKPSNILITRRGDELTIPGQGGDPVLIDLGIAALIASDGQDTLTADGSPLGSPAFMAPEQARGDRGLISTRSDVYALGAVGYFVLTGDTAHLMDGTLHACVRRVADDPPRDPTDLDPTLPRSLAAVLQRACAHEPGRRYASAQEFADDLQRWLTGERVLALPPGTVRRAMSWGSRHPIAVSAALTAGVGAVVAWLMMGSSDAPKLVGKCLPALGGDNQVTGVAIVGDRVVMVGSQSSPSGEDGLLMAFDLECKAMTYVAAWPGATLENGLEAVAAVPHVDGKAASFVVAGKGRTLTADPRGSHEAKGIVAQIDLPFARSAEHISTAHNVLWYRQTPDPPGAFEYGGMEVVNAVAAANEMNGHCFYAVGWGNKGSGQPRMFVSKLDEAGSVQWTRPDQGEGQSCATGVTVLAGSVYVVGWVREGDRNRPFLRRYDNLGNLTLPILDPMTNGCYAGVCRVEDGIVAVGWRGNASASTSLSGIEQIPTDGVLVDRWDSEGRLVWSLHERGAVDDQLRAVAVVGQKIVAVGSTRTKTKGGSDVLLVEVDAARGKLLGTTTHGGPSEDWAVGIVATGSNVHVGAVTRSWSPQPAQIGQKFPLLLRYVVAPIRP